jgi:hypothetical protein
VEDLIQVIDVETAMNEATHRLNAPILMSILRDAVIRNMRRTASGFWTTPKKSPPTMREQRRLEPRQHELQHIGSRQLQRPQRLPHRRARERANLPHPRDEASLTLGGQSTGRLAGKARADGVAGSESADGVQVGRRSSDRYFDQPWAALFASMFSCNGQDPCDIGVALLEYHPAPMRGTAIEQLVTAAAADPPEE